MSKGTPVIPVRISHELQAKIHKDMAIGHNHDAERGMDSLSDWIRVAIVERLAKKSRSRQSRKKTHAKPALIIGNSCPRESSVGKTVPAQASTE